MIIKNLTPNKRRILRCKAYMVCENSKSRRKYKYYYALVDSLEHITKVNVIEGNRGIIVTGGFGFDTNGNPISKRLS